MIKSCIQEKEEEEEENERSSSAIGEFCRSGYDPHRG
jgi:hypothetical protein